MTTTYGGGKSTSKDMTTATEKVVGNATIDFTAKESKEHQEYTEEAKKAENEGKKVQQGNDGETFVIEKPATDEQKNEVSNADGDQLSDDKLADMLPQKQEDNKVETEIVKEESNNKVETETSKEENDNKVETETDKEKLTVVALDGNTAIVGSSIQFKVTGENVTFEGLEGYNYAYNNNILTVQTGSEATVLTIAATDATGASILFDININGIVG